MAADLAPGERLQPYLLDRFIRRARGDVSRFTPDDHRRAMLRDLTWLLNSKSLSPDDDLDQFAEVQKSVVNYGLPDISGSTASSLSAAAIEQMVKDAIVRYEPRVKHNTLRVRVIDAPPDHGGTAIFLEIKADVWAMHESLYIRTRVDVETGMCELHG